MFQTERKTRYITNTLALCFCSESLARTNCSVWRWPASSPSYSPA